MNPDLYLNLPLSCCFVTPDLSGWFYGRRSTCPIRLIIQRHVGGKHVLEDRFGRRTGVGRTRGGRCLIKGGLFWVLVVGAVGFGIYFLVKAMSGSDDNSPASRF